MKAIPVPSIGFKPFGFDMNRVTKTRPGKRFAVGDDCLHRIIEGQFPANFGGRVGHAAIGIIWIGRQRVQRTTLKLSGSPEATPSENGSFEKLGRVAAIPVAGRKGKALKAAE